MEPSKQDLEKTRGFADTRTDSRIEIPEILGHYRIQSELGRGGMGVVLLAEDTRLGRQVAIKVLPQIIAQDADAMSRLEHEARILATLDHPNIATIYALEKHDEHLFITLQYVRGNTLATKLESGALELDQAVLIATQIVEALDAAQHKGVIHRDLKPANIQVTPDGVAKVLDFGLARTLLENAPIKEQEVTGTFGYMSPEQLHAKPLDVRTDIWSFGCIFYECLTGQMAFPGSNPGEVMRATLQADPDLSFVPEKFRELISRCLAKKPNERWSSFNEIKKALTVANSDEDLQSILVRTHDNAIQRGQQAPRFSLLNTDGAIRTLDSFVAGGPVILHFYRGVW